MRVFIDVGHPAHVHFFRHFVREMEQRGNQVLAGVREKEMALYLLEAYGIHCEKVGRYGGGMLSKAVNLLVIDARMYRAARKFRPDLLMSVGSPNAAHVSALLRRPHIAFDDTEFSREQYRLYAPFTRVVCTPSCFKTDMGKKQLRYEGYHELAYLHPNYFKPQASVLDALGLKPGERCVVVRFVAWKASHDAGQHGFTDAAKMHLVAELQKHARVFITSEGPLPAGLNSYKLNLEPEKVHDLLSYASLYIGEGATMATEAAILGTPSVYVSSLAGKLGNHDELENKYGLLYAFTDPRKASEKALALISNAGSKEEHRQKRARLLADKIDVTRFMVDLALGQSRTTI